jgi:DNA-binding IclR family transcriptional regulator
MFCPRPIVPFRTGFFLLQCDLIVVPANRFGISDEELELGMRAMAVPVVGESNEIIAAIRVSVASARVRTADLRTDARCAAPWI